MSAEDVGTMAELDRVRQELEEARAALRAYEDRETDRPPPSGCVLHQELTSTLISEVQGFRLAMLELPGAIKLAVTEGLADATVQLTTRVSQIEVRLAKLERWHEEHLERHAAE